MVDANFPEKNKYRSKRRQLFNKKKNRVRDLIRVFNWGKDSTKLTNHLQFCDNMCCHNNRDGNSKTDKTRQELISELKEKDWTNE